MFECTKLTKAQKTMSNAERDGSFLFFFFVKQTTLTSDYFALVSSDRGLQNIAIAL